jgi:streptogramin lyase
MAGSNVWFTEAGASRIGRVTMTGAIKEFAVPSQLGADIVSGAAGDTLWITDYTGNGIVRFTA